MASPSKLTLEDGAIISYEILGGPEVANEIPLVLVGGMAIVRGDWDRIAPALSQYRPVLVYDHRGIGDSTLPHTQTSLAIKDMARDLIQLVKHIGWKQVSLCGFSMGGVVVQHLLLFEHLHRGEVLPFRLTHVFLTGTTPTSDFLKDDDYNFRFANPGKGAKTLQDMKNIIRPTVNALFDPAWVSDPANAERYDTVLTRMLYNRPRKTMFLQTQALSAFDFSDLHQKVTPSPSGPHVMVIHGKRDAVIPFRYGSALLARLPHACTPEVGSGAGQLPTLEFGHQWFEYFDASVWVGILDSFIRNRMTVETKSKL
ncbi:alpha/beta-hydrolase [Cylindrobasidium torrendii FP15055 ss-10]|uniref:Alpha/beta-hydrolase n=1 Tax=Cylindrobasidium torrendii FP15055 ss-10 TaxID=1314674 RepID=A0A0D7BVE3_9AGAR|nr:alpha/beta-hydrolase [Cylindrobasidium torrendii FP15055 ss-10]